MKFLSNVYWSAKSQDSPNRDSVTLQEVMTGRGRVLFCVLGTGAGEKMEGAIASGYMVEQLIIWFYQKAVVMISKGKSRNQLERSILCEIHNIQSRMKKYTHR